MFAGDWIFRESFGVAPPANSANTLVWRVPRAPKRRSSVPPGSGALLLTGSRARNGGRASPQLGTAGARPGPLVLFGRTFHAGGRVALTRLAIPSPPCDLRQTGIRDAAVRMACPATSATRL